MLRAEPNRWGSWHYKVLRGDVCFAQFDFGWWRSRGEIVIDRAVYQIQREGFFTGDFVMRKGTETVVSATKPSFSQRRFWIVYDDVAYILASRSSFERKFILQADGIEVGAVRPNGLLSRTAIVDLPPDMPLDLQMFLTWLAVMMWKRQSEGS